MHFLKVFNLQLLFLIIFYIDQNSALFFVQQANQFLRDLGIKRTTFDWQKAHNGRLLVTNLDRLRDFYVLGRKIFLAEAENEIDELYRNNRAIGKLQPVIPDFIPFPCNLTNARSPTPPASVHRLRPGDIDIVAVFGDSLSAGNGILSAKLGHIGNEFRSLGFSGGGHGNWRNTLTLPNILKVFNPNLYGYAAYDGLTIDSTSHLNIAEPMLMSRDLPYQAKVLVQRLRYDQRVDMQQHWKLLTIFIGSNDICSDMCHHDKLENFISRHERDLRHTLTILRDQVPRLIVNLLPAPNMVSTLYKMRGIPLQCELIHLIGCHCVISQRYNATYMERISKNIQKWQQVEQLMAKLPEFQTNDFTVIYHPFTENPPLKTFSDGNVDLRIFAWDCFHFSQLGQAGVANTLWNSMLQPIGRKQKFINKAFEHFECPSEERPYVATIGNS